jgi:hypothetical protein
MHLRFLYTAENGPFESTTINITWSKPLLTFKCVTSQVPQCDTVWVEQVRGKESQPCGVDSLLVDIRRSAYKRILVNSLPPESVEGFSKSANSSYVAS